MQVEDLLGHLLRQEETIETHLRVNKIQATFGKMNRNRNVPLARNVYLNQRNVELNERILMRDEEERGRRMQRDNDKEEEERKKMELDADVEEKEDGQRVETEKQNEELKQALEKQHLEVCSKVGEDKSVKNSVR